MGDHHAQRRADRQCAVGGDAVPGNHASRVLGANPAYPPGNGAGAYHALAAAKHQAAYQQDGEAKCRYMGKKCRYQQEGAAEAATDQAT